MKIHLNRKLQVSESCNSPALDIVTMAAGVEVIPSIAPPKGGAHHALPIPQPHSPASSSRHPLAGFEKLPISSLPLGIMSLSLGNPRKHSIDSKIIACASQGWQGIEIHMDDITAKARSLSSCPRARVQEYTPNREEMLASARAISALCKIARLRVICLEPFLHYPGLPLPERTRRLEQDLPLWFELSDILGTNLIQVASSMFGADRRPGVTGSEQRVVEDLLLLAKAGQRWHTGTKYFAYEAMCFGAYVRTWQQAWRQIELVDQENFGMVFDTFQMLGAAVADPALPGGFVEGWQDKLAEDVQQLRDTFVGEGKEGNRRKLFFCQLGDAKLPDTPLDENNPLYDPKQHGA